METLAEQPLQPAGRPRPGRRRGALMTGAQLAVRAYGMATARTRPDLDFMLIGTKRGGTTSFYLDLVTHPQVCPLFPRPGRLGKEAPTKGIHFFDVNFYRGERWYRSYLPSRGAREDLAAAGPVVAGEASPYYLFHPAAAERAAMVTPGTKILLLLRDPVYRTYSHWKERRRAGVEPLPFVDALAAEPDRLGADEERLAADPHFYSYAHEQQSYRRQSEYAPSLERWLAYYPRDRVLVLSSESYYRDPQDVLARACGFLGLPPLPVPRRPARNAADGPELDRGVRDRLAAHFAPHNERLQKLTGQRFGWL